MDIGEKHKRRNRRHHHRRHSHKHRKYNHDYDNHNTRRHHKKKRRRVEQNDEPSDIASMIERRRKYLSEMHSRMMRHDHQKGKSLMSIVEQDAHYTPNKNSHHRRYQNRLSLSSSSSSSSRRSSSQSKSKRLFSNDMIMGIKKQHYHSPSSPSSEPHKAQSSQTSSKVSGMASEGNNGGGGIDSSLNKLARNVAKHVHEMIETLSSSNTDGKQPLLVGWIIVKLDRSNKKKNNDDASADGEPIEYVLLPESEPEIILDGERRDLRTSAKYVFQRYKATKRHLSDLNEKNFSLGVVLYNIKMRRATAYKLSIKRNKPGEESKFGRNKLQCKLLSKKSRLLKTSLEAAFARRWKVFD